MQVARRRDAYALRSSLPWVRRNACRTFLPFFLFFFAFLRLKIYETCADVASHENIDKLTIFIDYLIREWKRMECLRLCMCIVHA